MCCQVGGLWGRNLSSGYHFLKVQWPCSFFLLFLISFCSRMFLWVAVIASTKSHHGLIECNLIISTYWSWQLRSDQTMRISYESNVAVKQCTLFKQRFQINLYWRWRPFEFNAISLSTSHCLRFLDAYIFRCVLSFEIMMRSLHLMIRFIKRLLKVNQVWLLLMLMMLFLPGHSRSGEEIHGTWPGQPQLHCCGSCKSRLRNSTFNFSCFMRSI